MTRSIVLASRSPRRRALLEEAIREGGAFQGLVLRIEPPDGDEAPPLPGEPPADHALRLARAKAEEVASRLARELGPGDVVLGADTVVDLGGEIIGQPADDDDARAILRRLSGRRQAVVTGVVLIEPATGRRAEGYERTELEMSEMSEDEIAAYVSSGESRGKAGAYAIQETGDRYVRIVSGSRSNVVGLPMERVAVMLEELRASD
ncbi:MAG: Maf family protein [Planctomycetota bacterium]|jgi:septum formation protein